MGRDHSLIDLAGHRFGRLFVLSRAENNSSGKSMWLCRCDCGAEKKVAGRMLREGRTSSCNCLRNELSSQRHTRDIRGQKFGELKVLNRAGSDLYGQALWECACSCGNVIFTSSNNLLHRTWPKKSCGCHIRKFKGTRGGGPMADARRSLNLSVSEAARLAGCDKSVIYNAENRYSKPKALRIIMKVHGLRPSNANEFRVIQAFQCGYCYRIFTIGNRRARQRLKNSRSGRLFCCRQHASMYQSHGSLPLNTTTELSPETVAAFAPNVRDTSKRNLWTGAEKMLKEPTPNA
jgi:hypothetical protein